MTRILSAVAVGTCKGTIAYLSRRGTILTAGLPTTFVQPSSPTRESLKRFLLHFAETTDVLGNFSLDPLEARDRQLKFQGVRFEVRLPTGSATRAHHVDQPVGTGRR